jgi:hypothetical protein
MITALVALLQKLRHVSLDWFIIGGLFVLSFGVLALLLHLAKKISLVPKVEDCAVSPIPESQDEECKALRAIAEEDAEKIRDRVRQIGQRVEFHFTPGSDPYIEIFTELLNASVFDVVTFGKVEGHTMYGGQQLSSPPQVFDKTGPPGPALVNLKHGESGTVRIRQFISTDVADRMWADRSRNIAVDMSLVRITFRMLLANRPLREFQFYGPRTTIDESKRV